MSDHAEVVREALKRGWHDVDNEGHVYAFDLTQALAALDALVAERDEDKVMLARQEDENRRLWNHTEAAEAERDKARERLALYEQDELGLLRDELEAAEARVALLEGLLANIDAYCSQRDNSRSDEIRKWSTYDATLATEGEGT